MKINARSIGLVVGGLLVLGSAVLVFTCSPHTDPAPEEPPVRPAKTAIVETRGAALQRAFSGVVQSPDRVDLSFRVSGPLVELPVKAGDKVEAGDVVARIDPRDFRSALARVESSLDQARAQLAKMKAGARIEDIRILEKNIAAAQVEYDAAAREMERNRPLYESGDISESEFDGVRSAADVAKERLDAAKQELELAKAGARAEDIEAQEAAIRGLEAQQKVAADALADTTLKAPFDGVIARRYVDNYKDVRAKSPIVGLQSEGRVQVVTDVPETVAATVKREYLEKLTVAFEIPGSPEFEAELEEFTTEADPRTQTYAATVGLPAPEAYNILPGMSASVRIYLKPAYEEDRLGLPVPADALFVNENGEAFVWVVDDALTVRKVSVTTGDMTGTAIYVKTGLEGGERIVTAGVHFLEDGMKIRLIDEDA
jgi:RND family efflux transporter MFP subunit